MAGLTVWIAVGIVSIAGIETPDYEVVSEHDGYEIRHYEPYIAAEVKVEGKYRESMNGGFRTLADYIFGNNTTTQDGEGKASENIAMTAPVIERVATSESIAMTAPVVERESQPDTRFISFIMPSEYTMDTLPRPNNPNVNLVEVPAKRFAAIRFSGRVPHKRVEAEKASLLALLERDQVETVGEAMLAQYNPPWTPPPMRRNEVLVEIAVSNSN